MGRLPMEQWGCVCARRCDGRQSQLADAALSYSPREVAKPHGRIEMRALYTMYVRPMRTSAGATSKGTRRILYSLSAYLYLCRIEKDHITYRYTTLVHMYDMKIDIAHSAHRRKRRVLL